MLFAQMHHKCDLVLALYGQIAYCYHILGEYEVALYYYQKQLKLACQIKDRTTEAQTYDYMGIEYYYLGNLEWSVYYHDLAMNWGTTSRLAIHASIDDSIESGCSLVSGPSENNYENNCSNKMNYIRSKNFSAYLTQSKLVEVKKKFKPNPLPATVQEISRSSFSSPASPLPEFRNTASSLYPAETGLSPKYQMYSPSL